jgi:hypothetical protein
VVDAPDILLDGGPNDLIVWTFGGKTFKASRRTFAHLWWTQQRLSKVRPGATIRILQGCYNTGVEASAGTHDFDACVDTAIDGWDDWYAESRFYREHGWADWVRNPSQGFPWHHHQITRGFTTKVGKYIDGGLSTVGRVVASSQIDDFNRHALGLSGGHSSNSDPQCWGGGVVSHKLSPVFDYARFKEDQMALSAEDKDWIAEKIREKSENAVKAAIPDIVNALLDTELPDGDTVRKSIRQAGDTKALALEIARQIDALNDAK